jgi:hypothetical protein
VRTRAPDHRRSSLRHCDYQSLAYKLLTWTLEASTVSRLICTFAAGSRCLSLLSLARPFGGTFALVYIIGHLHLRLGRLQVDVTPPGPHFQLGTALSQRLTRHGGCLAADRSTRHDAGIRRVVGSELHVGEYPGSKLPHPRPRTPFLRARLHAPLRSQHMTHRSVTFPAASTGAIWLAVTARAMLTPVPRKRAFS